MTSDKMLRLLFSWMVTLALETMSCDGADPPPRAPRVVDGSTAPTSIVIQDHRDMIVNFTLKVTGQPLPKCDGWSFQIDPMRKEVPRNRYRFVCKALKRSDGNNCHFEEFRLVVSNPTKQDIGQYSVRFFNNEGSAEYKFEIKGKEENKTWLVVYIVTAIGGAIVLATIVVAIAVVFRGHCCRSRRSRRSVERARDSVYDNSGNLRESTRKPHSRSRPAKPQRTSRQSCHSTTTTTINNNTTAAATPKAESSSADALPWACAKFPPPNPPPVDSHSSPAGGREFLCVEPDELAKAISFTLKRYQLKRSNNALLKSRRMSRSVPGLHEIAGSSNNNNNYNGNLTTPRERFPFQALMPPPTFTAAAAATAREMGLRHGMMPAKKHQHPQQQQQQQQQKECRAKCGSAEDSGFAAEWEDDDSFSVLDSVSTVAAGVTRRRKYSLDEQRRPFWRQSLKFVSGEVTSDSDSDSDSEETYSKVGEETGRKAKSSKESKYMTMTSFYRGSRFPSQHKEAGDVPRLPPPYPDSPPLPPPPPPLPCVMQRVYQNLC